MFKYANLGKLYYDLGNNLINLTNLEQITGSSLVSTKEIWERTPLIKVDMKDSIFCSNKIIKKKIINFKDYIMKQKNI